MTEKARKIDNVPYIDSKAERFESLPIVSYRNYETVCNYSNDGSRVRGILSEEMYEIIVEDPSTEFIVVNSQRIPAFIDYKYGMSMGYDPEKCVALAGETEKSIRILSIPVHELDDDGSHRIADLIMADSSYIFFSDHNGDEASKFGSIIQSNGMTFREKPLIDERAAKGDEQAGLYLYSCRGIHDPEQGEQRKVSLKDVRDYFAANYGPETTPDGKVTTSLMMGDEVTDAQVDELWSIYNNRFDFLGEGHPISMQDTKEEFMELLRSPSVLISASYAKYEDGSEKLMCFTYFIDDIKRIHWLNQGFLEEKFTEMGDSESITNVFTPGVVSVGFDRSYAPLSIGLFAKMGDEAGMSVNVMFENTNLSKKYIPRIVNGTMRRFCDTTIVESPRLLDEVQYRLWSIDAGE